MDLLTLFSVMTFHFLNALSHFTLFHMCLNDPFCGILTRF